MAKELPDFSGMSEQEINRYFRMNPEMTGAAINAAWPAIEADMEAYYEANPEARNKIYTSEEIAAMLEEEDEK